MISDFKFLKSQWCFWNSWIEVYCSFNNNFTFITKEKLLFSLMCIFYCGLMKKSWALKVAVQFAVRGLVAYNTVAYKIDKCISLHFIVNIFFKTHFYNVDFYEYRNSFLNSLWKQFFFSISNSRRELGKHGLKIYQRT